jgi:hypothetical protein
MGEDDLHLHIEPGVLLAFLWHSLRMFWWGFRVSFGLAFFVS